MRLDTDQFLPSLFLISFFLFFYFSFLPSFLFIFSSSLSFSYIRRLKAAFLSWQEEGAKIATHHLEFANKVNTDIVKPLESFLKTKEPERRKVCSLLFFLLTSLVPSILCSFPF